MDQISPVVEAAKMEQTNLVPTRVRWHVVALLAVMAGLTYIDRLNLGIAGKYVQEEFKFDSQTMGWIFGAFSLGYAVFHLPGGWLADRFGARRVLTGAVLCFSIFTAVTAIAPSLPILGLLGAAWSFATVRFVMGLGEAAAIPVANKMMAYWLGEKERAFGTSIFLAGVGAGGRRTRSCGLDDQTVGLEGVLFAVRGCWNGFGGSYLQICDQSSGRTSGR